MGESPPPSQSLFAGMLDLQPHFELDEDWSNPRPLLAKAAAEPIAYEKAAGRISLEYGVMDSMPPPPAPASRADIENIRALRIQIANHAITTPLPAQDGQERLLTRLGMNMIVPRGRITELRLKVDLTGTPKTKGEPIAVDGFPNDRVDKKVLLAGSIQVCVTDALEILPYGDVMAKAIKLDLEPWNFRLGTWQKVKVDFSGPKTSSPEWYFQADGIKDNVEVALTLARPAGTRSIRANVTAQWLYRQYRFWGEKRFQSQSLPITII